MAKYMLLMYGDAQQWESMTPDQAQAHDAAHAAFRAAAGSRIVGGQELEAAPMATTLRSNPAGRVVTTDGPFLETKEAIGGFYLVTATSAPPAPTSCANCTGGIRLPRPTRKRSPSPTTTSNAHS
jgi:hypothetical protein